ncbi:UbiA-like protein EboC [Emticicia sp. BO119]|uniref:UbiA-like protein EboC n=1 Tax=Emticicia sp. BO119 TaxID=2757768 RepID=UPI0015EFEE3A|nr:UbiA-like protein EboC [Emticicia sp. BO119]MBA4853401.1 UbiA-like protein EboC [Emticicia sp. BO119]
MKIKPYLQLTRPANIITAISDILAGTAIAGFSFSFYQIEIWKVIFLCFATIGLYGGGIVFNDIFDLELDRIERPERAIPSGKVSKSNAIFFGILLLLSGVLFAWSNSLTSAAIAFLIAICALVYDKYGKHHTFFGPINMGLCRGGNLILGMSIIESSIGQWGLLSILPVCYIAAITMISRGEVHGGNKNTLYFASILYIVVSCVQLYVSFKLGNVLLAVPFIFLHIYLIFKPLLIAINSPIGPNIGKAVKAGVLSLIVMNAAWVSVSGNIIFALLVLCLLPVSISLAKYFAVT